MPAGHPNAASHSDGLPHLVIVLVTPDGPGSGGGTQQALRRLIPLWIDAGHPVTLLTHPVDERWEGLPAQVEVVPLPAPSPRAMHSTLGLVVSVRTALRAARAIRRTAREHPDATILPFLPGTAILSLLATWGLGSRVIPCERNDPTRQRFHPVIEAARRVLYRRATAITVNAEVARDAFEHRLRGRVPVHLVANPLPDWPNEDSSATREDRILSVGRLVPQKRHDDVIRAFALVAADCPSWRLIIVGEGPERAGLERLVADLSLKGRVELSGHLPDVRPLLISSRLLVLASEFEGTSNVLLEGLMSGLEVIVSDAVSAPSAPLRARQPPHRFRVGDVEGLAELLSHCCHRNSMKRPGDTPDGLRDTYMYDHTMLRTWQSVIIPNREPS